VHRGAASGLERCPLPPLAVTDEWTRVFSHCCVRRTKAGGVSAGLDDETWREDAWTKITADTHTHTHTHTRLSDGSHIVCFLDLYSLSFLLVCTVWVFVCLIRTRGERLRVCSVWPRVQQREVGTHTRSPDVSLAVGGVYNRGRGVVSARSLHLSIFCAEVYSTAQKNPDSISTVIGTRHFGLNRVLILESAVDLWTTRVYLWDFLLPLFLYTSHSELNCVVNSTYIPFIFTHFIMSE